MQIRKRAICLFITAILLFQVLNVVQYTNIFNKSTNSKDEEQEVYRYTIEIKDIFSAVDPDFTRTDYPVIISNETAPELWTILDEHHVDNIRIAYYNEVSGWQLVTFQLDEKAYFRRFTYTQGSQASISLVSVEAVDISNWGYYTAEHRYAGKDIDAQPGDPYKEPTKYECELGFWDTKLAEGWDDRDLTKDPGKPDPAPTQDPREAPGGIWDQHEHRIDYDDELVFYAQNGQQVDTSNWWNAAEYPNRTEIHITDPVDGGQTWMYLYFNDDIETPPPTTNYFIPSGGEDLVDWDPENSKITADKYEFQFDPDNKDLVLSSTVKLPGYTPINISTDGEKQWMAINLHIQQSAVGIVLFDVQASGDIWREGEWLSTIYNEQTTSIGYGITMDLDLINLDPSAVPGQDTDYTNGQRTVGLEGQSHDGIEDIYKDVLGVVVAAYDDDADHDGVAAGDYAPFLRGIVDFSGATNGAAIDGPCRVILDRTTVQAFGLTMGAPVNYEEFWTITDDTTKFYAGMVNMDPTPISTNYSNPENPDQLVEAHLHYTFMNGERFTEDFRSDPESFIMLGQAPNGDPDLPNLPRCRDEGKTWPLILNPNGLNDDDLNAGGGPVEGHYDNTPLVTTSTGTGIGDGNPVPDWIYSSTSSGGVLVTVPYQGAWQLFENGGGTGNGDFAMYWNDNTEFSELAPYGNDGIINGVTGELPIQYVFGMFDEWECKREYARLQLPVDMSFEYQFYVIPEDTTPPTWVIPPSDAVIEFGTSFYQDVEATDPSTPITYSIDDTANFNINPATGEITNAVPLAVGVYPLIVSAEDLYGNSISAS
ncbi:MAG: cadherin repeat domain-containing protein, partial [Promethearchaeota archaeon]